ncbi:hypothetical protein GGR55DRAFT_307530 [Xylaria sp. FL0064]|nr:hypothetical protein GGR55DRAFT_307530 [Xylaria sp. FL0064]
MRLYRHRKCKRSKTHFLLLVIQGSLAHDRDPVIQNSLAHDRDPVIQNSLAHLRDPVIHHVTCPSWDLSSPPLAQRLILFLRLAH